MNKQLHDIFKSLLSGSLEDVGELNYITHAKYFSDPHRHTYTVSYKKSDDHKLTFPLEAEITNQNAISALQNLESQTIPKLCLHKGHLLNYSLQFRDSDKDWYSGVVLNLALPISETLEESLLRLLEKFLRNNYGITTVKNSKLSFQAGTRLIGSISCTVQTNEPHKLSPRYSSLEEWRENNEDATLPYETQVPLGFQENQATTVKHTIRQLLYSMDPLIEFDGPHERFIYKIDFGMDKIPRMDYKLLVHKENISPEKL
jgi:hypothetical protein